MDIIFFIVILLAIAILIWQIRQKREPTPQPQDSQALVMLQNQMNELAKTLERQLGASNKTMLAQSDRSVQIVKDITSEITKVTEGQKQIATLADQLKSLQDILKNPKQRGVLGEYFLETVLKNVLPPGTYQLQYPFADGTKVDAVILYQEKVIPIDSKFSLENYNRLAGATSDEDRKRYQDALRNDLKIRIDETAKYIKPDENTVDFAFMFIPSEALYYDLLVNKVGAAVTSRDLIQYSAEKRVYPVSPTTFHVYLQMVFQGMRQSQINKSAEHIIKSVGELQRHLERYEDYLEKVGSHLTTTTNAYNTAYKEFGKIDKDIIKISGAEAADQEPEKLL